MSEHHKSDDDDPQIKGGLESAPVTPTEEKSDPETGTGSADKRSPDSIAEKKNTADGPGQSPGAAGGNITN